LLKEPQLPAKEEGKMPRRTFVVISVAVVLLLSAGSLFSQTVSEKKEIAVFKLSYYRWDIPNEVLGGIDEEIRGVFISIGRFDVIGLTQRLEEGDVNQFIDKLKEYKERTAEIPQEVQMGKEFFTQADFNRLVGSFIVVIPTVANYVLAAKGGKFQANIKTSFTFINVEEGKTFAHAFVDTQGSDQVPELAVKEAMDAIPMQLTFEIRKIPEFQVRTGILEVAGREVILELGRNMGIKLGDEYVIVAGRVLGSGRTLTSETGLLVIKQVSEEVSVGQVIYAHPRPQVGDQLQEVPLLGIESTPYVQVAGGLLFDRAATAVIGVKGSMSRGFWGVRPIFGLEVPLIANILAGIPLNLYGGVEYMLYVGRLSIAPMAAAGFGGAYLWYADVPDDERFVFTYVGGKAGATVAYQFTNKMRVAVDVGYMLWYSLAPTKVFESDYLFPDYDGVYFGAGLTIKL
jgi:hypothetical protein